MSNVLESHELARHFADAIRHRPLAGLVRDAYASYFLELPASFDEYLAARSSKFRNYLKRVERKIAAESEVSVTDYTAVDEVDRAYDMLLEIERASWKHEHGTAISAVPHQVGFYRDLCQGAAARGRLHLQVLSLGGRPAAYNLGYIRDSTYFYLKTSYGEAWRQLGVATWLRARLIRSLIERAPALHGLSCRTIRVGAAVDRDRALAQEGGAVQCDACWHGSVAGGAVAAR